MPSNLTGGTQGSNPQYSGATTTANSAAEGRLKVAAGREKKRKILKKLINKK